MSQMSAMQRLQMEMLAAEAAARHFTPKATVTHPKGVICQGDEFMTGKIEDPDYVPYCGPCVPMQRLRRVVDGFKCPTCGNKSNWDLTKFNGNINVQFDPERADMEWVAKWQESVKSLTDAGVIVGDNLIENALAHSAECAVDQLMEDSKRSWTEDVGKKNTSMHDCGKCGQSFFGKKSRKFCVPCQGQVTQRLKLQAREEQNMFQSGMNRADRRSGYHNY